MGQTSDESFDVSVNLDQAVYWRVDETNDLETPSHWQGEVWQFSTAVYTVVDNMEAYADEEFKEIWATWVDGFGDPANGAIVGNGGSGSPERANVYDGGQSMPYFYGDGGAAVSEATRTFEDAQDWSQNGIKSLSLEVFGDVTNTPGQMYIEINGVRVADYLGPQTDLTQAQWHAWQVDLSSLGITTVNTLTLGVEGGGGKIIVDAIRLYPYPPRIMTPTDPDDANLVAYYPLNNDALDMSGNGRHGSVIGGPTYGPGPAGLGSGLLFDGTGAQYVDLGTWNPSAGTGQLTVSLWIQWSGLSGQWQGVIGKRNGWSAAAMMWDLEANIDTGVMRFGRNGSIVGTNQALIEQGEWDPWAVSFDGTTASIYRNGQSVASGNFSFGTTTNATVQFGSGESQGRNAYNGALSEVRLYNQALSPAEIATLAGRTEPIYLPFE